MSSTSNPLPADHPMHAHLSALKGAMDLISKDPMLLYADELQFLMDFLKSIGASIPPKPEPKKKAEATASEKEDSTSASSGKATVEEVDEEVDEEQEEEEEEDPDRMKEDTEPFPAIATNTIENPDYEAAGKHKMAANDAKASGDFAKAVEELTQALLLAPSPMTYGQRAQLLLKMKRPLAAIRWAWLDVLRQFLHRLMCTGGDRR